MPLEVLHKKLVDVFSSRRVAAGIGHGAATISQVIPHHKGYLPQTFLNNWENRLTIRYLQSTLTTRLMVLKVKFLRIISFIIMYAAEKYLVINQQCV
jgi:hypothetical protein